MFIKNITIQGFKSYRDQTFEQNEFSPKHNVIVGRNGSGKSNFFNAIIFVLSEKYSKLRADERQAFLHEGTGRAVMNAFVEIVFDNSDSRLPIDKEEVAIRRTIGLKKDEYRIDGKPASQKEVMNLLESAGFSSSNPYYIVEQGKVTALTNMKDVERLELLKEVAGTKVYDERRKESTKILIETKQKKEKIDEVVTYIDGRLKELDAEKKRLKEFQKLDHDRRAIEYTLYDKDLKEANNKIEEIDGSRQNSREEVHRLHQERIHAHEEVKRMERELKEAQLKYADQRKQREILEAERQEAIKTKTKIDLQLGDFESRSEREKKEKVEYEKELVEIRRQIKEIRDRIKEITPNFTEYSNREQDLQTQLRTVDRRIKELYTKQSRNSFKNAKERNDWLDKEIKRRQKIIKDETDRLKRLDEEIKRLEDTIREDREKLTKKEEDNVGKRREVELKQTKLRELKDKRDQNAEQRKEYWKRQSDLEKELRDIQEQISSAEQKLQSTTSRATTKGYLEVKRIVRERNINGVYGTVIELFTCSERYNRAVEVTAGQALFHIVVDTAKTAANILKIMNEEKIDARVSFFPLDSLKDPVKVKEDETEFIPLLKKVKFNERDLKVFSHIFGRTYVCSTVEAGSRFAREHGVDCVTLDGNQVNRRGALTGGFTDVRQSRMAAQKTIEDLRGKGQEKKKGYDKIREQLNNLDQQINLNVGEVHKLETSTRQLQLVLTQEAMDQKALANAIKNNSETLEQKKAEQQTVSTRVKDTQANLEFLQKDRTEQFTDTNLTVNEARDLKELTIEKENLDKQITDVMKLRADTENERNTLLVRLNTNYTVREDEIDTKLKSMGANYTEEIESLNKEANTVQSVIDEITEKQEKIDEVLGGSSVGELEERLTAQRQEEANKAREIEKKSNSFEKILNKRKIWLQKREDCLAQIRELGTIPSDVAKFADKEVEELRKKLHRTKEKLKEFTGINKKALDQYEQFTTQKEDFRKKKDELDNAEESIQNLIRTLDKKKDDAIYRTFKQVSLHFEEIFKELVPNGSAKLIIKNARDAESQVQDDDEEEEQEGGDQLISSLGGVGIQCQFTGDETRKDMNILSGGQKSLVALTLIFAIQRCDSAAFYLFDEIDAALDSNYRTAVGTLISKQAEAGTQFITTTFKSEMVNEGDQWYGIEHKNKVSTIVQYTKEKALALLAEVDRQAKEGEDQPEDTMDEGADSDEEMND